MSKNKKSTAKAQSTSLVEGTLVGNYIIEHSIGEGGVGKVYRAHHRFLRYPVAIKVLEYFPHSSTAREAFLISAVQLAHLHHPNIAVLYDYGFVNETPYMVLEYIRGNTLLQMIPDHPSRQWTQFILQIFPSLLSAIRYAHQCVYRYHGEERRGIVHGDIKPSNILIRNEDQMLKLLDFLLPDLKRLQEEWSTEESDSQEDLDPSQCLFFEMPEEEPEEEIWEISTEIFGTPGYMPPEQYQGELREESDIYALGATLYHCLTGRSPEDFSKRGVLPRTISPYIPKWVEDIIVVAMEPKPENRFHSVAEMEAVFLEALHQFAPLSQKVYDIILGNKIEVHLREIANITSLINTGSFTQTLYNLREHDTEAAIVLGTLKDAIVKSEHLSLKEKEGYIEMLDQLGTELLNPRSRRQTQKVKVLWEGLLQTLKVIPDVAQAITALSDLMKHIA